MAERGRGGGDDHVMKRTYLRIFDMFEVHIGDVAASRPAAVAAYRDTFGRILTGEPLFFFVGLVSVVASLKTLETKPAREQSCCNKQLAV